MAHTPGPWAYDEDSSEVYSAADGYGTGWIALVKGNDDAGVSFPETMRLANARLIAAAPELLACLQSLRVVFASLEGWRDMDATLVDQFISSDGLHRVEAAIAKATGKESE